MSGPLIFLSYGRRDTQALAERLRADLKARDYEVWRDIERIRTGWDWDEEIEAGLRRSRALLADAPVLVLDEPTAHLDPATARSVMDDVVEASRGKTVLLITHRREGLEHMHEIVRLDGGAARLAPT